MMKKSFISILLLAMVMILAISAVSAAEDIDSSDAVIGEVDEVPLEEVAIDDDALEASDDADVVAADGDGNFTSLQDLVNTKDEITLEKNYTRLVDEESVVINKTVTIAGDNIQIDGKNLGTIFKVKDTGFLTLKGITLINGNAEKGGAIFNEGKLTVENCKFINNTAKYRGGAIYSEGIVNIDNTVFDTNDISYRAGKAKDNYGGATIFNLGGNLTVSNSKVLNSIKNYVYEKPNGKTGDQIGGAITSSGSTIILNSEFDKNSGRFGADICVLPINAGDVASLTIDNCNFTNARSYAGGVHIENAKADISNSKFENYVAGGAGSPGYSAAGGVICAMSETELSIENCTFNNNTAPKGGAILAQRVKKVSILNSNFTDNNATGTGKSLTKGYGGAVLIEKATDSSVVDGCTFINNTGVNGGAVAVDQNIVEIKNSNFDGNKATNGTAVYNNGTLTVSNNTFGENDTIESETIVAKDGSNVTISPIDNVTYGTPVVVYYTIENRTRNVTVSICYDDGDQQAPVEGVNYTLENDKVTIKDFAAGDYVIIIFNNEDNNYELSSAYAFFTVDKVNSSVAISPVDNVTYGESVVVEYVIENKTNNVTVSICYDDGGLQPPVEGVNYTFSSDKVVINNLTAGKYVIFIYNGDENVTLSSDYAFFTVKSNSSVAINPVVNVTYGNPVVVEYVIENRTNNVTVSICYNDGGLQPPVEGVNYTLENDKVIINDLAAGDYVIIIFNNEDDNVALSSEYAFFNVTKAAVKVNLNVTVDTYGIIHAIATFDKNVTGNVTFLLGKILDSNATLNVTTEIVNGVAEFSELLQVAKGYYGLAVKYDGDANYNSTGNQSFININKEVPAVNDTVDVTANQAKITLYLPANATGNVTCYFLSYGTNATFPIVNGTVVVDEIFDNGDQSVLFTYDGDDKYYGFYEYYVDFFVKASSFISAKDVSVVYQNNGKVTVTLTDNNDKKGNNPIANAEVVVTVNGKSYKGTTDAKGIATVTVPAKLVPKAYTAKVSYAGTNTTIGDTSEFKFTVKKATPKVTAKKKTFKKSKKVKKYTITLKDNKGKAIKKAKVTIKVGKKTFKAKTNAKGKAVFKLKKLTKKAKYNAKVTYKGNKYFKKVTKKVKITIK